jgi:hypothetical protein
MCALLFVTRFLFFFSPFLLRIARPGKEGTEVAVVVCAVVAAAGEPN